jgi:small subunit ribosomal protein S8
MSMTDPIADYLTRIRNATRARHSKVDIPASNILKEMTRVLLQEGYIREFTSIDNGTQGIVRIYLKYDKDQRCAITGIQRMSRPGYRRYTSVDKIPRVLNGLGISILTTPKGILAGKQARKENVGGEVLCTVW